MAIIDNVMGETPEEQEKKRQEELAAETTSPTAASPMDAAAGGMNPDQAKMLGTPAQTEAMAQQSPEKQTGAGAAGLESKQDFMQSGAGARVAIDQNAAQQAKQATQNLQGLGSFSSQIEAMVKQQMSDRTSEGLVANEFDVSEEELTSMAAEGREEEVRALFQQVQNLETRDPDSVIGVLAGADKEIWGEDPVAALERIYKTDKDSISQAVSSGIAGGIIDPADLTAERVIESGLLNKDEETGTYSELGLTEGQLVDILGEDWKSMKLDQIESKVNDYQRENMSSYDRMQEMIADPTIPASVKQQLQSELASMGASGELASFQEGQQAVDEIAAGKQVRVGEELVSADELLDDENMRNDITSLLADLSQAELDGVSSQEFLDEFGALYGQDMANMVSSEFTTMKEEGADIQSVLGEVKSIQESNQDVLSGDIGLGDQFKANGDKMMKALGFSQEGPFGGSIDFEQSDQYQYLKDKQNDPAYEVFMNTLSGLDEETLDGLGQAAAGDMDKLWNTLTTVEGKDRVATIADADDKLAAIGPNSSWKDLAGVFGTGTVFDSLGDPAKSAEQTKLLQDIVDVTGDPKAKRMLELYSELEGKSAQEAAEIIKGKLSLSEDGTSDIGTLLGSEGFSEMLGQSAEDLGKYKEAAFNKDQERVDKENGDIDAASGNMNTIDQENRGWMKDGQPDSSTAYNSHPSRGKWKSVFDKGPMGPGSAQGQGARIFSAMAKNPKIWDSFPDFDITEPTSRQKRLRQTQTYPQLKKEHISWIAKNIGLEDYNENGNTGSSQTTWMIKNIMDQGDGDFKAGLKNMFGKDVSSASKAIQNRNKQNEIASREKATNRFGGK